MTPEPVFAQKLAVIRGDHNESVPERSEFVELGEELLQVLIQLEHGGVVLGVQVLSVLRVTGKAFLKEEIGKLDQIRMPAGKPIPESRQGIIGGMVIHVIQKE